MHIREAVVTDLMKVGLKNATDVMVSGCSAGGLATYVVGCPEHLPPPLAVMPCRDIAPSALFIWGRLGLMPFVPPQVLAH
jgi:hypothetical protein